MKTEWRAIKDAIRDKYAWPGGYALHLVMSDGCLLCMDCARKEYRRIYDSTKNQANDGWRVVGVEVYREGPDEACCHCQKTLPSEYGDQCEEEE